MSELAPRTPLYDRLPEIYRERDATQLRDGKTRSAELVTPGQLQALVGAIDRVMAALAARLDAQYDDLFIDTCDDWVIPYLADLVGTSHLSGEAWALRADVARTVFHRSRKGTLGAIESQVRALSGWAVHAIELRDRLAWNQHLNHLRPDAGGAPPFRTPLQNDMRTPVRGGTAALRAPAWLAFAHGPFDPFAHTVDVKPVLASHHPPVARTAINLPNLGVFVWRLAALRTPVSRPSPPRAANAIQPLAGGAGLAAYAVRFEMHPNADPMVLFNTHRFHADDEPPSLAGIDALPAPMPRERLTSNAPAAHPGPGAYVAVDAYAGARPAPPADDAPGLVLHVPAAQFAGDAWTFRGANLCGWETPLAPPLGDHEIAIDPAIGRVVFGVRGANAAALAQPLANGLFVSAATGFPGSARRDAGVGAEPLPRAPQDNPAATVVRVDNIASTLAAALDNLSARVAPLIVEIANSDTYRLDLGAVVAIGNDAGMLSLRLPQLPPGVDAGAPPVALTIRAASGERPVIRLVQPLRFRPAALAGGAQAQPNVLLQGLYITRDAAFPAGGALVEQTALNRLEIDGCTLDPGGQRVLDGTPAGTRAPIATALRLAADLGLTAAQRAAFGQVPEIVLRRTICGRLAIDPGFLVGLEACIVDGGAGVAEGAPALAIGAASLAEDEWSAPVAFKGLTVLGRARTERARGDGAIFVHGLEVNDNQDSHAGPLYSVRGNARGSGVLALLAKDGSCIKWSYFSATGNRLPQHFACVFGGDARLRFTAEHFGQPGYGDLAWDTDRRIRESGPGDDEMGAFNFLGNTHRWKNIGIRLREFMPVGMRALPIPVAYARRT